MSGLAKIMLSRGYLVSGSDLKKAKITEELEKSGADITYTQDGTGVNHQDLVVISAAIKENNGDFAEAKRQGLKMIRRSELLGELMVSKRGIAVAGTHGKTTTSTMLSLILEDAGLDPVVVIGGEVKNIGGNAKDGHGEYLVAEACEYERAFWDLKPYIGIITNIEEDHLDTYGDMEGILEGFAVFLEKVNPEGFITVWAEDRNIAKISKHYQGRVIDYGLCEGQFQAKNIITRDFRTTFEVWEDAKKRGLITLTVPGPHNILNALSVIATALNLGVKFSSIQKTLQNFSGAKRRFEIKGEKGGILVIDDYAHHPTEIKATLSGLRDFYPDARVWCIFQPHQYSRTFHLLNDFKKSFYEADHVIIPEIYEARDTKEDRESVNSKILVENINKESKNAIYISDFESIVGHLLKNVQPNDIIITVGAGNVYQVGEQFLARV